MNHHVRLAALIAVATALPLIGAAAQTVPTAAACTYQACALREEREFWGRRLVRGATGEKVGNRLNIALGRGAEVLLESPSDSARAYGRAFVSNGRRSGWLGLVAVAGYVVVATRTNYFHDWNKLGNEGAAGAIGGGIFLIASGVYETRASRDLTRGVWWYNSALPH